jgi:hypothetical protein
MTGSRAQWYNGMALLAMFFSCRLIWGTWQSIVVYTDMWKALQQTWTAHASPLSAPANVNAHVFYPTRDGGMCIDETCARANAEVSRFKDYTAGGVPTWLVLTYVVSNLILNFLNYFWFSKMVETVLKRFRTPEKKDNKHENREDIARKLVLEAAAQLEEDESAFRGELPLSPEQIASGIDVGTLGEELRKRRAELVAKVPLPGA